ncbi:MAG: hypothetical protein LQ350_007719, partial [Teloschistes chrysophthalmus]
MNDVMEPHRPSQNAASDANTGSTHQSPVLPLADYICSVRQFFATIRFPRTLIQAAQDFVNLPSRAEILAIETTKLVEALDDGTTTICRRLDNLGFQIVYAFIRRSEPCLSQQRGHCIFIESLQPCHAQTAMQKASLVARKAELGKGVLCRLITTFLDGGKTNRARRWVGSLALELLKGQALVQSVLSGNDEILRLIGGTIIHEVKRNTEQTRDFWPSAYAAAFSKFPVENVIQSQWATEFTTFIDHLDSQKLLTQDRGFSTFAYAVHVDGTTYNTEIGLSIMVSVADDFTITVPSTETDTAKYIDVPLKNIVHIDLAAGGSGSQSNASTPSSPTVLVLHLLENAREAYYINESSRLPCQIQIAFDERDDAQLTKYSIETIARQRSAANTRALRQMAASSRGPRSGRPSGIPESGVLMSTEMLNVSQKEQDHALIGRDNDVEAAHEGFQPTSSNKAGRTIEALLDETQPHGVKRKPGGLPRITPNKKAKISHTYNDATTDKGDGDLATLSDTGVNEFDVPTSPHKPQDGKTKSSKSSGTFKVSKDGGKVKGRKALPKAIDNKVKTTKMKQQAKAAGPQKPALLPRITRAAAKNAQLKVDALDEEFDDEEGGALIDPAQTDIPGHKEGRIVVTVSGKGGNDDETTNSVGEAANVGQVAHAERDQLHKPKTPAHLTEILSEALSNAFPAYQSVPKGSTEVDRNVIKAPTIKLEPESPGRDMPNSDWVTATSGPSEGAEGTDGSSHRQSMATRSADVVDDSTSKIGTGSNKQSARETSNVKAENHKDPHRIPNVIGFNEQGPRNQGLLSPLAFVPNRGAGGLSQVSKRKRDDETSTSGEALDLATAQGDEQPRHKKARTALYNGPIGQNSATAATGGTEENPTRGLLLDHSSLFTGDTGSKVSTQGSRVNYKGSPLPDKHLRGEGVLNQDDSEKPRFVKSSNSKNGPSSPNAPSAILTGLQAEDACPFDMVANGESREFVQEDQLENPFITEKTRSTGKTGIIGKTGIKGKTERKSLFMDKLRAIHDLPGTIEEDPDKTLVEDPTKKPLKNPFEVFGGAVLTYGESSETSSSQQQPTQSTHGSKGRADRWRNGLEIPHGKMADVLDGIKRDLIDNFLDAEMEVDEIVRHYQRHGDRMLARVAEELRVELDSYTNSVNARHKIVMEKMQQLNTKIAAKTQQKKKIVKPAPFKQLAKKKQAADDALWDAWTMP